MTKNLIRLLLAIAAVLTVLILPSAGATKTRHRHHVARSTRRRHLKTRDIQQDAAASSTQKKKRRRRRRRLWKTAGSGSKGKGKGGGSGDDFYDNPCLHCPDEEEVDISLGGGGLCFSALVKVQVQDKGLVAMKDLQVGDSILVSSDNDAKGGDNAKYESVYAFGHYHPTAKAPFYQFHTSAWPAESTSNKQKQQQKQQHQLLEVTAAHLVFLQGQSNPKRADSIQIGDVLHGGQVVHTIFQAERQGLYAPLTPSGKLMVWVGGEGDNDDDQLLGVADASSFIQASSYIALHRGEGRNQESELQPQQPYNEWFWKAPDIIAEYVPGLSHQDYVHMGLSPFRLVCHHAAAPAAAAASQGDDNNSTSLTRSSAWASLQHGFCHSYDSEGMPYYASFAVWLNQWARHQPSVLHCIVLVIVTLVTGMALMLEEMIMMYPLKNPFSTLVWLGTAFAAIVIVTTSCFILQKTPIQVHARKLKTV